MKILNKKLQILYVGFNFPPDRIGGVSIYTNDLMKELVSKGHRVSYFFSEKQTGSLRPTLRKFIRGSVMYLQLINSPHIYPAVFNNLPSDNFEPVLKQVFANVLTEVKPQVIHFQDFFGVTTEMINVARATGAVVVTSLHNYYPICPTFNLFNRDTNSICDRKNCINSCWFRGVPNNVIVQKLAYKFPSLILRVHEVLAKLGLKNFLLLTTDGRTVKKLINQRDAHFRQALNNVHMNLAVSKKVKELYVDKLGINPKKIKINYIGSNAPNLILNNNPIKKRNGVVTFVFLGRLVAKKGFTNLLEAFKRVNQSKARLYVYAPVDSYWRKQRAELEKTYNIRFKGPYRHEDLNTILNGVDVGIVPPIWEDNLPQVLLEMQSARLPVIGSAIGGIPDLLKDGHNGLLFRHDRVPSLINRLNTVINSPSLIEKFSKNVKPIKKMKKHAWEMESLYYSLMKPQ